MALSHELRPEERDIRQKLADLPIDYRALAAVSNIWRAAQAMKLFMERSVLREFDLSWAGFSTLFIIWIWGPIELRELARQAAVSRPTATSNVSWLEARGLCQRQSSAADRRLVLVELTPSGRQLIEQIFPRFNQGETAIAASLGADEQETLAALLRRVIAGIGTTYTENSVDGG